MISARPAYCKVKSAFLALVLTPLVAGCAVYSAPAIKDRTGKVAGLKEIAILAGDKDGKLRNRFREELQASFGSNGVKSVDTAETIGDFAISIIPADATIASSKAGIAKPATPSDINIKSEPRRSYIFDGCEAVRIRASLVLFDRASGNLLQRSEGTADGCKGETPPTQELAELLARNVLM